MDLASLIDQALEGADFGVASARKTGRDARWPYVPVVMHGERQAQVMGLAFATRAEAVAAAEAHVAASRALTARQLAEPRFRALRESYGLPRELS